MILDSNLIIYSAKPEHPQLREFIAAHAPSISVISVVEDLGFHRITPDDKQFFELFFQAAQLLPVNDTVVQQAVALRQSRKMSLGDSLIAATAMACKKQLLTNNMADFQGIPGLQLMNPLAVTKP